MKKKQFTLCAALIVVLSIGGSAWAAENVALDSGSWSNATNWSEGHVPNTTDDRAKIWSQDTVTVDYAAPDVSNIRLGSNQSHRGKLVIDTGASLRNQGILEISGGHLASGKSRVNVAGTLINDGVMNIGHVNGTNSPGGVIQVSTNGAVTANSTVNIGYGAQGRVEITGGTFTQVGAGSDTYIGVGSGLYGELFMDGGTYKTGDDLILAGNGNNRTGKVDLNGGAYLDITDSLFAGLNQPYTGNSSEIIVSDATMRVDAFMYLGRQTTQSCTLTLDHADADVNAWGLYLASGGGTGEVDLLDGVLTVRGVSEADTLLTIGSGGSIDFEKGVLAWNDNTTEDELQAFWSAGTFTATKNGANPNSFTNVLDSISYTQDLGDGYTVWVGLDGGVAKTFVTTDFIVTIGDISINIDGMDAIIGWSGTNGANYTLQSKGDLTDPSWSNALTGISGVDGGMSATTTAVSVESFYRVTSP